MVLAFNNVRWHHHMYTDLCDNIKTKAMHIAYDFFASSLALLKNIRSSFTTSCFSNLPLTKTNEVVTIYHASRYNSSL